MIYCTRNSFKSLCTTSPCSSHLEVTLCHIVPNFSIFAMLCCQRQHIYNIIPFWNWFKNLNQTNYHHENIPNMILLNLYFGCVSILWKFLPLSCTPLMLYFYYDVAIIPLHNEWYMSLLYFVITNTSPLLASMEKTPKFSPYNLTPPINNLPLSYSSIDLEAPSDMMNVYQFHFFLLKEYLVEGSKRNNP